MTKTLIDPSMVPCIHIFPSIIMLALDSARKPRVFLELQHTSSAPLIGFPDFEFEFLGTIYICTMCTNGFLLATYYYSLAYRRCASLE